MPDPIIDPVNGFEVPESWIELSRDPQIRDKIRSGLWVLLSNGSILRRGFTTGTTAAAACKGAILSLVRSEAVKSVEVMTPAGLRVSLNVEAKDGACIAIKDGGDHQFDVTDGIQIKAQARPFELQKHESFEDIGNIIELIPGAGIGIMTGRGIGTHEGKAAISRSARKQIIQAIYEGAIEAGLKGIQVELSVPTGREIALKTLNASLGIIGGISILGSTGFVEPWNDHLCDDRLEELKSLPRVVATTGRKGLKFSRVLFPDHKVVLVGSNLEKLHFSLNQNSILCGLPALILKWAWPQILEDTGYTTVAEMVDREPDHPNISKGLKLARAKLPFTRIVLIDGDGKILRDLR